MPRWFSVVAACALLAGIVFAQQPTPPAPPGISPQFFPRPLPQEPQPQNPPAPNPPAQNQPTAGQAAPANPQPAAPSGPPTVFGGLSLNNASLTEVIDLLARQLKISYILDPRVRGGVILNTYGEIKNIDTRSLLDLILRLNGAGMVKQGEIYRIVPLADLSHLPLPPESKTDADSITEDDQAMFNLIFLKYVTADELSKVLQPFIGEGATMGTYPPANLLLVIDSRRSMRRLMDLIAMFDSDQLANQRVHVFEIKNGRPSDLAKELENIEKSISLSEKSSPIKFLPIDRINTIIAVAPNPGAFAEVEKWIEKLDTPVQVTAGGVTNYVYRVRYGDAMSIGCSIQALYQQMNSTNGSPYGSGSIAGCMMMNGFGGGMYGGLGGGGGGGGFGGGGFGSSLFGGGMYGGGGGGMYGAGMYGGGGGGMYGSPYGAYGAGNYGGYAPAYAPPAQTNPMQATGAQAAAGAATAGTDLTGSYLGNTGFGAPGGHVPRVVPNPLNNTLLIQATSQEYENIQRLLKDLDVPPRQVLIDAKIYSVDVTHGFSSSVQAALQKLTGTTAHTLLGGFGGTTSTLTLGALVGRSREVASVVTLMESESRAKQLSAPAVIATDSIPASINVGASVPTLTAQAVTGVQQGGNSLFANSVSNVSTGTTLNILARVTPTGVVTMVINQQVSQPTATTTSSIQSPSFATQSVQTQLTVQDGDTIAIGGAISETNSVASSGIPGLSRIPILGAAFGTRSYNKDRTELIIFLTPRVIYDSNAMVDASDELKSRVRDLRKDIKE